MSYEYLKGMGNVAEFGGGPQGSRGEFTPPPPQTPPPPATDPGAASRGDTSMFSSIGKKSGGGSGGGGALNLIFSAKSASASGTTTPTVPAGSVMTSPAERIKLKEWCRQVFGETSDFYKEKLRTDVRFTHVPADTLAAYRNAVFVVDDMLRGNSDGTATAADISGFKTWWKKCHAMTFYAFSVRQQAQDAFWVPLFQFQTYRTAYKAGNICPPPTWMTKLFEYRTVITASRLLSQERTRRQNEMAIESSTSKKTAEDATAEVARIKEETDRLKEEVASLKREAKRIKEEGDRKKREAMDARKQVDNLNSSIRSMQNTIDQLNQQLAGSSSPDAAAQLQKQIDDLTKQLIVAKTQVPVAQEKAQETAVAAVVAEEETQQADQMVAEADVILAETQPWHLRYKWHLLGGAVILAGCVYWFMSKRQVAVPAMAKNWLPEPTSSRRPSGLKRNRRSGR